MYLHDDGGDGAYSRDMRDRIAFIMSHDDEVINSEVLYDKESSILSLNKIADITPRMHSTSRHQKNAGKIESDNSANFPPLVSHEFCLLRQ